MPTQPKISTFDSTQLALVLFGLICLVTCCVLWANGRTPPDVLQGLTTTLIGVFVGVRLPASGVTQIAASAQALNQALDR